MKLKYSPLKVTVWNLTYDPVVSSFSDTMYITTFVRYFGCCEPKKANPNLIRNEVNFTVQTIIEPI